MKVVDDRQQLSPEEKLKFNNLIAATNKFMSGWGKAAGGNSYVVYCCEDKDYSKVMTWMQNRNDFIRVRQVMPNYKPNPSCCSHIHYYVVKDGHPALR